MSVLTWAYFSNVGESLLSDAIGGDGYSKEDIQQALAGVSSVIWDSLDPEVLRRALDAVGDEDLALRRPCHAAAPQAAEHGVQQGARRAHEGLALRIFLLARCFAHHHPVGLWMADPGHRMVGTHW